MIAIVDYGMGNRRSVEKALAHVGAQATITHDQDAIRRADGVILPGVGAFPQAMRNLDALDLSNLLREIAAEGVPLLGICLGMQLLFDGSEEHEGSAGLGILGGTVARMDSAPRLPHIGWSLVKLDETRLTAGLGEEAAFYHVHSYECIPSNPPDAIGVAEYGEPFVSIVERDNVFGAQFHPEKSSRDGLALLRNFADVCAKVPAS